MPVVQKVMTEGISHSYEDYFPNLDKYFRFTTVPLADYFITTGADITSIKKAEQALRAAHDELEVRVQKRTEELAAANLRIIQRDCRTAGGRTTASHPDRCHGGCCQWHHYHRSKRCHALDEPCHDPDQWLFR